MSRNPLVSVLMTVYNEEEYLDASIRSILSSTFRDFEFIIIDDGSTDGSGEILNKWVAKDQRIKVISQNNTGIVGALNNGIKQCNGLYVARMDADDTSSSSRLELQAKEMREGEVVLVGGFYKIIDTDGHIEKVYPNNKDLKRTLVVRENFVHGSVMLKKSSLIDVGGYRDMCPAEDYDLWSRLADRGEFRVVKEATYNYRINPNGLSATRRQEQIKIRSKIQASFWKNKPQIEVWTTKDLAKAVERNIDYPELVTRIVADNRIIGIKMIKHLRLVSGCRQLLYCWLTQRRHGATL